MAQADNIVTYIALEEAFKEGKCKAIGLSNLNKREFLEIYNTLKYKNIICLLMINTAYNLGKDLIIKKQKNQK